jgi:hypothetical protein
MQCPACDVTLSISSREGIEIDFCPQCRGVWLDRGELDKVIERNLAAVPAAPAPAGPDRSRERDDDRGRPAPRYDDDRRPDDRRYDDRSYDDRSGKKRKRRSLLEDLFDFD